MNSMNQGWHMGILISLSTELFTKCGLGWAGLPLPGSRLAATIQRLPSITDEFYNYHDQWYQHVKFARQVLPSSIYILGNEGELREIGRAWSNRSRAIPADLEPKEGCTTVADSQFCMPINAQLSLVSSHGS